MDPITAFLASLGEMFTASAPASFAFFNFSGLPWAETKRKPV